jgi:hypothetical protein
MVPDKPCQFFSRSVWKVKWTITHLNRLIWQWSCWSPRSNITVFHKWCVAKFLMGGMSPSYRNGIKVLCSLEVFAVICVGNMGQTHPAIAWCATRLMMAADWFLSLSLLICRCQVTFLEGKWQCLRTVKLTFTCWFVLFSAHTASFLPPWQVELALLDPSHLQNNIQVLKTIQWSVTYTSFPLSHNLKHGYSIYSKYFHSYVDVFYFSNKSKILLWKAGWD